MLRAVARSVLRAADDAVAALADGYEHAQRLAIRQEEAMRREFIDDLLGGSGDLELLVARAERFGLRLASDHVVAVATTGPDQAPLTEASSLTRRAEAEVAHRFGSRDVLVATKSGLLVCVVPAVAGVVDELSRLLHRLAGVRVGVGRPHAGPLGVAHSYEEARDALDLAGRPRAPVHAGGGRARRPAPGLARPSVAAGRPARSPPRTLAAAGGVQYGRGMMRMQRRRATMGLVALAMVLGSLWAGGGDAPAASLPAGQLAAGAAPPAIEPGALPDRIPALRPPAQRPDLGGRLLPLLLGLLAASLTVAHGVPARGRRSSPAPARSLVLSAPRGPRAPPFLQPV